MWCSSLMIVIYFEMYQKIRWTDKERHRKRARHINMKGNTVRYQLQIQVVEIGLPTKQLFRLWWGFEMIHNKI